MSRGRESLRGVSSSPRSQQRIQQRRRDAVPTVVDSGGSGEVLGGQGSRLQLEREKREDTPSAPVQGHSSARKDIRRVQYSQ